MKLLKELRKKARISQKEISEKLGFSTPQYISNVERGISTPTPKMLKQMAESYGVNYENLAKDIVSSKVSKYNTHLLRKFKIT